METAINEAMEFIGLTGDNSRRLTQAESVEFYESIASECRERAQTIRSEMGA